MMDGKTCYIIAEIGINHNGDLETAKKLIQVAADSGCNAVKFQKRTVDVVYTPEELARPRENPFGETNGDLKFGIEFGRPEYDEIDAFCAELNIDWFASPWDEGAVDFLTRYDVPYLKIASASITDKELLEHCASSGKPLLVSTGMCDLDTIWRAVDTIDAANGKVACLYHCVSTYPAKDEELNLTAINTLRREFPNLPIGYSGHEVGVSTSVMAAVLGAVSVERHVTLDRAMWGSDQAASLEPAGIERLVRDIRTWEAASGDGVIRVLDTERPIAEKLRRKFTI